MEGKQSLSATERERESSNGWKKWEKGKAERERMSFE